MYQVVKGLINEAATVQMGEAVAVFLCPGVLIGLSGELGVGKTTLTRGILKGLGYRGVVRSPTYSLVEAYPLVDTTLYHFDLYRISRPEELCAIGVEDYLAEKGITIVEWPERGKGVFPPFDLLGRMDWVGDSVSLVWRGETKQGDDILKKCFP